MNIMNNKNHNNPNDLYPVSMEMPQLAHAYVPFQFLSCLYTPEVGLKRGTIFPELDRPYGVDPEYTVDA